MSKEYLDDLLSPVKKIPLSRSRTAYVRAMTLEDLFLYDSAKKTSGEEQVYLMLRLMVCDKDGNLLFSRDDHNGPKRIDAFTATKLIKVCNDLMAFEDAEKN